MIRPEDVDRLVAAQNAIDAASREDAELRADPVRVTMRRAVAAYLAPERGVPAAEDVADRIARTCLEIAQVAERHTLETYWSGQVWCGCGRTFEDLPDGTTADDQHLEHLLEALAAVEVPDA